MSMKENVEHIKGELNSEEKFIESFVKVERFYKKYKTALIGGLLVVVIAVAGYSINSYTSAQNKIAANDAFATLMEDPNNTEAFNVLKDKNPILAQIIEAKKVQSEGKTIAIDAQYLSQLPLYDEAIQKQDSAKLATLSMQNDFLLKEYALFQQALMLTQKEEYIKAKEALKQIPEQSQVNQLSSALKHFLLTK